MGMRQPAPQGAPQPEGPQESEGGSIEELVNSAGSSLGQLVQAIGQSSAPPEIKKQAVQIFEAFKGMVSGQSAQSGPAPVEQGGSGASPVNMNQGRNSGNARPV